MMTSKLNEEIGKILRSSRVASGYSQQEVADYVGVTRSAVSRWENGEVGNIGRSKILKLSEALNISPIDIVLGENIKKSNEYTNSINIPVYGSIPAGVALEAIEDIHGYEDIPAKWLKGDKEFLALKVKGDSMYPKYLDGDIVIVQKQQDCESGQDCVCYVNDYDATLKKVIKNNGTITLKPLNPNYPPQTYNSDTIHILGVVKELRRKI